MQSQLLVNSLAAASTNPAGLSRGWLFLPAFVLVLSIAAWVSVYIFKRKQWVAAISGNQTLRSQFRLWLIYVSAFAAGLSVDWSDASSILDNQLTGTDITFFSLLGLFLPVWIFAQQIEASILDSHVKDLLRLENAKRNRNFLLRTVEWILSVVGEKADRLHEVIARGGDQIELAAIKDALRPEDQKMKMIIAVQQFIKYYAGPGHSVRVAYFEENSASQLELINAYDGSSRACIRSPLNEHKIKFDLSNPSNARECLSVAVALGDMRVAIPDASAAHSSDDVPFRFFDDVQRDKIKSIYSAAMRRLDDENPKRRVLTIDTNRPGLFGTSTLGEEAMGILVDNLTARFLLEVDLGVLFDKLEGSLEQQNGKKTG